jgi:predicted metal-dependent phosphoesterase TrpH
VLIDLHCHTAPLSSCSALDVGQLVQLARARGLDGICLTEHDRAWPEDELGELRRTLNFPIFSGVELTTDLGHVLAFGLKSQASFSAIAAEVFEAAERDCALLFLAHPARDGLLRVDAETVRIFSSVEAINGSDSRLQNMAATGLASGFRLPGIAGSDAHTGDEVGRAATRFERKLESNADLLRELGFGRYTAVPIG